ncbi:MAG: FG-GAP-like repeat-containing protein, partial [Planctomycetota bacterium]|nr:FG-GAP-like repeat-containing protein [Planctomycetota bacterium]
MFVSLFACLPFCFVGVQEPQAVPTFVSGQAHMQAQEWSAAEAVFRARVKANDKEGGSWYQLGLSLHNQARFEEALAIHERAAGFQNVARLASYNAGCAASRLGQADAAFTWLGKAVGLGFGNRQLLATDKDLESIRKDARFATVLPKLVTGPDLFLEKPRLLHTFVGEAGGDQFGWVARVVGDLDGDGAMDFATSAPTAKGWSGLVYVYSGRSGKELFRLTGQPGWQLGNAVEGRGDVNGDGVMDVVAGAPSWANNAGHVIVASGKDGSTLHQLSAGVAGDRFGTKVSTLQDMDGDGHGEILVGAPGDGAGKLYVYSGKTGEVLHTLEGEQVGDQFGCSMDATHGSGVGVIVVGAMKAGEGDRGRCYIYHVKPEGMVQVGVIDTDAKGSNLGQYFASILGDVDGDGVPDVYASDWNHGCKGPGTGRAFIHSGATGKRIRSIDGRVAGEAFGTSQASCGDANGDGVADLCVGAWANSEVGTSAGKVYLVSGADGSDLATWTSVQAGDTLGFDAVGMGDVDGDGNDDFLLTSAWSTVQFG